jgi:hypothetical protein
MKKSRYQRRIISTRRSGEAWHFIPRIYCMLVLLTLQRRLLLMGRLLRSNLEQ